MFKSRNLTSFLIGLLMLCGFARSAGAQTAANYIAIGRGHLANQTLADLQAADSSFSSALAIDPTNPEANVLKAMTRLVLLVTKPEYQTLLSGLGVTVLNSNPYHYTYQATEDAKGKTIPAAGATSDMVLSYLNATLLPEINGAVANLQQVTDPGFVISLSAAETSFMATNVDYGDVQIALSGLLGVQALVPLGNTQNISVRLPEIYALFRTGALTAETVLSDYPALLTYTGVDQRVASKTAFQSANAAYQTGSNFIRNIRSAAPGTEFVFSFDTKEAPAELRFRTRLAGISAALNGPTVIGNQTINLLPALTTATQARSLLPGLSGNLAKPSTWPDATMAGVLPGGTQAILNQGAADAKLLYPFTSPVTITTLPGVSGLNAIGFAFGGGTFNSGDSVTVTASPNYGYSFVNWTENGTPVSTAASYNFTASANRTLTANFSLNTGFYAITASASPSAGGTVFGGAVDSTFGFGEADAYPAPGYSFVNWTENGVVVSTSANYSFTPNSNRTLVANFALTPSYYSIATSVSPSGGGVSSYVGGIPTLFPFFPGGVPLDNGVATTGSTVAVVASPLPGSTFVNWTENGAPVSTSPNYSFTASASRTLVANFTNGQASYAVTPYAGAGGNISPNTVQTVASGGSVTFTATPNSGYAVDQWLLDGNPVRAGVSGNSYTLGSVTSSHTVQVTFISASSNADLASLIPSAGALSPVFDGGTLNYVAAVPQSALNYAVTPTVAQTGATVTVNGTAVVSGSPSGLIPLRVGVNPSITVVVTAPDGVTTQTYTVTVTRAGTAPVRTDLTGVGRPNLIFQNTATGQLQAWFLDGSGASINFGLGSGILGSGYLYGGSLPGWQLAGVADVNGDGNPDLVFQNTGTGQVYAWFLDGSGASINFTTGSGIKGTGYLYGGSLPGWRLAGIADVNADGIPDLIFQNTATGQIQAWLLDGSGASINFGTMSGIKSTGYLYGGSLIGWQLAGVADVNADGIPDLVFQNTATGQVQAWLLDGSGASINFGTMSGIKSTGYLYGGSLIGWQLTGVNDVNGDGIPDLIFQNNGTGQVQAWMLDGTGNSINFTTGSGYKSTGWLYGGSLPGWQLH
jgi:hypothetical protein